jgi:hypothetical protein
LPERLPVDADATSLTGGGIAASGDHTTHTDLTRSRIRG